MGFADKEDKKRKTKPEDGPGRNRRPLPERKERSAVEAATTTPVHDHTSILTGIRLVNQGLLSTALKPAETGNESRVVDTITQMARLTIAMQADPNNGLLAQEMERQASTLDALLGKPGKGRQLAGQMMEEWLALQRPRG